MTNQEFSDEFDVSLDVEESTSTLLYFDVVCLDGVVQQELRDSINKEGVCIYEKV